MVRIYADIIQNHTLLMVFPNHLMKKWFIYW